MINSCLYRFTNPHTHKSIVWYFSYSYPVSDSHPYSLFNDSFCQSVCVCVISPSVALSVRTSLRTLTHVTCLLCKWRWSILYYDSNRAWERTRKLNVFFVRDDDYKKRRRQIFYSRATNWDLGQRSKNFLWDKGVVFLGLGFGCVE